MFCIAFHKEDVQKFTAIHKQTFYLPVPYTDLKCMLLPQEYDASPKVKTKIRKLNIIVF